MGVVLWAQLALCLFKINVQCGLEVITIDSGRLSGDDFSGLVVLS